MAAYVQVLVSCTKGTHFTICRNPQAFQAGFSDAFISSRCNRSSLLKDSDHKLKALSEKEQLYLPEWEYFI